MRTARQTLTLTEYQTTLLPAETFSTATGTALWQQFDQQGRRLLVDFPSPKTGQQWALTPQGWVGHIPMNEDVELFIAPKVPLQNLYALWEAAYQLRGVDWLAGLSGAESVAAFYEQLAGRLAVQVLRRARRGLYKAYRRRTAALVFGRGRIHPPLRPQLAATLHCTYNEQTMDLLENQVLAITLDRIARSQRCRPTVQRQVGQAARLLQSVSGGQPATVHKLQSIHYHRLNADYAPLHALCRFFLEHLGPRHAPGTAAMQPFLIDMARLFELLVTAWLPPQLPAGWRLQAQEKAMIGGRDGLQLAIDLVLYDAHGRLYAVLDTKYKLAEKPAANDVNQIISYATIKNAPQAILIYPTQQAAPLDVSLANVRLRSVTFPLDLPLATAGERFLTSLFAE